METRRVLLSNSHTSRTKICTHWGGVAGRSVGLREVRSIPVWSGTVQTLNRPETSRALDQQQGSRQHPTEVPAPSHEVMRYNVKSEYSPGKTLVVSDALSRSPIEDPSVSSTEEDVNLHVHLIESNLPVSPGKRSELQTSTRDDATIQSAIG